MKKLLPALLVLVLLLFAACGDAAPDAAPETDSVQSGNSQPEITDGEVSDSEEETMSLMETYGIKEDDFGGRTVTIITGEHCAYEYVIEEETGDVVNDAVYARNRSVEELLNVTFDFVTSANWSSGDPFYNLVRSDVMSGDSAYDIVNGLNCWTTPLMYEGIFIRLDDIDSIDFSHPWWVPGLMLDGSERVYYAFTDASLSLYKDLYVIFFNKTIVSDNNLSDPYEIVKEGKWTLDAFIGMGQVGSRDLNGDGAISVDDDQIAYVAKHAANRAFMTSTDTSVFITGDDGKPALNGLSERLVNVFEKMKPFLSDKSLTYVTTEPDMLLLSKPFAEGHVLFLTNCIVGVEAMRDMQDDYGIIPLPKYDEEQDGYRSQIATSSSALYLEKTATDTVQLGSIMEALGFYSWQSVVPAYYETALNYKYARDTDVRQMLAIVRDNATTSIDFAYNTIFWTNDVMNAAWDGKEIASWYAGIRKTVEKTLEKYLAMELE